ncbi:MAG: hypothetical protein KAI61_00810 [Alphaproteobacteria bacterium]|nr:hypothetical protein [Alphaproteobacteria bacterium]
MEKKPATLAEMLSDDFNTAVEVREMPDKRKIVVAVEDIPLDKKFGYFAGFVTQTNGFYALHLEGDVIEGIGKLQFLGHDLEPNSAFIKGDRWLYAINDIRKGDEVTVDYMHTEKELPSRLCV